MQPGRSALSGTAPSHLGGLHLERRPVRGRGRCAADPPAGHGPTNTAPPLKRLRLGSAALRRAEERSPPFDRGYHREAETLPRMVTGSPTRRVPPIRSALERDELPLLSSDRTQGRIRAGERPRYAAAEADAAVPMGSGHRGEGELGASAAQWAKSTRSRMRDQGGIWAASRPGRMATSRRISHGLKVSPGGTAGKPGPALPRTQLLPAGWSTSRISVDHEAGLPGHEDHVPPCSSHALASAPGVGEDQHRGQRARAASWKPRRRLEPQASAGGTPSDQVTSRMR